VVQRPLAKRAEVLVEFGADPADLAFGDAPPEPWTSNAERKDRVVG
jgi:hypothetical protein